MPRSSNHITALLLLALLSACQSLPEPAPEVTAESGAELKPVSADKASTSAEESIAEAEPVPVDLNQLAYEEAIAALKNGATDKALKQLTHLSLVAPDKPRLFTNLGLAYFQLQQSELAEQAFQQAVARDSTDAVAHNHLGILQRQQGHFQEALQEYQRAIKIDSKYAGAHLNLGILFDLYLQDLEKALQQYRKFQSLSSEENTQVAGWIIDIERRLKSTTTKKKG